MDAQILIDSYIGDEPEKFLRNLRLCIQQNNRKLRHFYPDGPTDQYEDGYKAGVTDAIKEIYRSLYTCRYCDHFPESLAYSDEVYFCGMYYSKSGKEADSYVYRDTLSCPCFLRR